MTTPLNDAFDAVRAALDAIENSDRVSVDLALMNAYSALKAASGHVKDARVRVQLRGAMRQIQAVKGMPMEDAA
jgi:hypothetical protein